MRNKGKILAWGLAIEGVAAVLAMSGALDSAVAGDARVAPTATHFVYLNGTADLEKLKQANPGHYDRAQKIIAASDELCKPGPDAVEFVRFEAQNISCQSMFIKTSNPPKRQLAFTLDDVRYVALITLTESDAKFRRVPGQMSPDLRSQPDLPQAAQPAQPLAPAK